MAAGTVVDTPATAAPRKPRKARPAGVTLESLTAGWVVTKRDGSAERFDHKKVAAAVRKCLVNDLSKPVSKAQELADRIATRTVNYLDGMGIETPSIEDVQRAVISQLWADGQYEAAEAYTLFREERRKVRSARQVAPEQARLVEADAAHFPTPLQYYQFVSKFARWRDKEKRRETWAECNERVFGWFATLPQFAKLTDDEKGWLRGMMYGLKASPAMRVVQMAGPALERCHVGCYNCAYHPITDLFAFAELLYILMQGTGGGFSVETEYVGRLPRVKKQKKNAKVHKHVVADDTEGWCNALLFGLQTWFNGEDVEFDTSGVREAGTRLKTKGGRASGPGPLIDLLAFARNLILSRQGKYLEDVDVHDLCCMIGKIVQVGGVRRASCISLSDLDSRAMRDCKSGAWWEKNGQRSMANNSSAYDEKPPVAVFMEEWLALVTSGSGERGIFNRKACNTYKPVRRKAWRFGCNPCAEIVLRPFQFCNLSIAVARRDDTPESLREKVRAAAYFGTIQACATNFKYIRKEWRKNCEEERLLGVDITGQADCPLLHLGAPGRDELIASLKAEVAAVNAELAARFGINRAAADTTVKPGGDSGVFFDCGSGVSPRYSKHQIRRTRESVNSPVCKLLKDAGVPWEPAAEDEAGLVAFAWPKKNPDGCVLRDDVTALQQLENWLAWKRHWAEHSVSVTIYVKEHEWFQVGAWVYEHFDEISGISFLPWDNGTYRTAPNEAITEQQYEAMVADFPVIDWAKLVRYEDEDMTSSSMTFACVGGVCER